MYRNASLPVDYTLPNKGLRREGFRSHFLLFIIDTVMFAILMACGVTGVVWMDGETYSSPPFYIASFVSATCLMSKATIGGCFSVHGLYVKIKPEEPETALVILHLVLCVISFVGYFVSIVVFGFSEILAPCDSSNGSPGCSSNSEVYKALGAVTLVIILISIGLSAFGVYLFVRFGKEFGVSPYKKSKSYVNGRKPPEKPGSKISVHHNEHVEVDDMPGFM